ncbi:hypothetical protein BLNAU_12082 [Blattamonas nauphoetae]|uniref:Uncharacterized protein n=1 Tax=Blattamonas nauphoetae TaxID=2049346 RepID=A0ABQ9XLI9_9EUKA|nr:hypothetical protein BLNAU_12082 [Blattamonas nauphoetae]
MMATPQVASQSLAQIRNPDSDSADPLSYDDYLEMSQRPGFAVSHSEPFPEPMDELYLPLIDKLEQTYSSLVLLFFRSQEGFDLVRDAFWYFFLMKYGESLTDGEVTNPQTPLEVFVSESQRMKQEKTDFEDMMKRREDLLPNATLERSRSEAAFVEEFSAKGCKLMERARGREERIRQRAKEKQSSIKLKKQSRATAGGRYVEVVDPLHPHVVTEEELILQQGLEITKVTEDGDVDERMDFCEPIPPVLVDEKVLPSPHREATNAMFDRMSICFVDCILSMESFLRDTLSKFLVEILTTILLNVFTNTFVDMVFDHSFEMSIYKLFSQLFFGFRPSWDMKCVREVINPQLEKYQKKTKSKSDKGSIRSPILSPRSVSKSPHEPETPVIKPPRDARELLTERLRERELQEKKIVEMENFDEYVSQLSKRITQNEGKSHQTSTTQLSIRTKGDGSPLIQSRPKVKQYGRVKASAKRQSQSRQKKEQAEGVVCESCGNVIVKHFEFCKDTTSPAVMQYFKLKNMRMRPHFATVATFSQECEKCECKKGQNTPNLRQQSQQIVKDTEALILAFKSSKRRL